VYIPNFSQFQHTLTKIIIYLDAKIWKLDVKTRLQPYQTIISFYWQLCFGCKLAHWKVHSKPDQIVVGHFCKFLINSIIFVFQSKYSSNLGQREYNIQLQPIHFVVAKQRFLFPLADNYLHHQRTFFTSLLQNYTKLTPN
jgi:hypothetical protein